VRPRLMAAALFVMATDIGTAGSPPPLPPPRPEKLPSPAVPPGPADTAPRPAAREDAPSQTAQVPDECLTRLKSARFDVEAADQPSVSNEQCRIEAPVRLRAVPVPSRAGTVVRLNEQPLLACRFAESFGHWLGDLVAPVVAGGLGTALKTVRTGPGFECRNRNRATAGKLSAHAGGLAIDISGFELANGSTLPIEPENETPSALALAAMRTAACGWFTTVLGPGSDAAHGDHLHVDVERHGSSDRYRICQ
jgi:hypothetical protein